MTAAVVPRTGYAAPEQTLLGDGAAWIWTLGAHIVAEATPVLDRWHLADARRRTLRQASLRPSSAPTGRHASSPAWNGRRCPGRTRRPGGVEPKPRRAGGGRFAAFLASQAPRIPDDAARRAAGLPIGSGGVETGVEVVVNRRFKGKRGMKWGRARAAGVLACASPKATTNGLPRLTPALGLPAQLPAF